MHVFLRASAAVAVGGMAIAASAAAAGADPNGMFVQLDCGGVPYEVVVAGQGEWTPAHDLDSNTVFIPLAFGDFQGTLTNLDTMEQEVFFEEGSTTKGNSQPRGRTVLHCTFSFEDTFAGSEEEGLDPDATYHFLGEGEVTLFATGPR